MKKLLLGVAMAAVAARVVTKWRRGHERDRWLAAHGDPSPLDEASASPPANSGDEGPATPAPNGRDSSRAKRFETGA